MSAAISQISLFLLVVAILGTPSTQVPLPQHHPSAADHDNSNGHLVEVQIVDHDGQPHLDDHMPQVTIVHNPPRRTTRRPMTSSSSQAPPHMPPVTPVSTGAMPSLYSLFDLIQTIQTPRPPPSTTTTATATTATTTATATATTTTTTATPGLLLPEARTDYQGSESSHVVDSFRGWAVFDDLDTGKTTNNTSVIAPQKKFGYIVHNNEHRRFRVEEKAPDGYIQGLFGMVGGNGDVRGVRYTADPSISPKFLFDTLQKFLSL